MANFFDPFTNTDATTLENHTVGGAVWVRTAQGTSLTITSNAVPFKTSSRVLYACKSLTPAAPNYFSQVDYSVNQSYHGGGDLGIRVNETNGTGYFLKWVDDTTGWQINRHDNYDNSVTLASNYPLTTEPTTVKTIKLYAINLNSDTEVAIIGKIGDQTIVSAIDTSANRILSTDYPGLKNDFATEAVGAVFDNFYISDLIPEVPNLFKDISNTTVDSGDVVTLSSRAYDFTSSQWYKNGAIMTGETSETLSFTSALSNNGDTYYNRYTNAQGTTDTTTITLTVNAPVSNTPTASDFSVDIITGSSNNIIDLSSYVTDGDNNIDWTTLSLNTTGFDGTSVTQTSVGSTSITVDYNNVFEGVDTITYNVSDSDTNTSNTATITFNVAVREPTFLETFTNTDATALESHNSNWTRSTTSFSLTIQNNALSASSTGRIIYSYTGFDTLTADYFAVATIRVTQSYFNSIGVGVRVDAATYRGYFFHWDGNNYVLYRSDGESTVVTLATFAGTAPTLDTQIRIDVADNAGDPVLTVRIDDAIQTPYTDSSVSKIISRGNVGIDNNYENEGANSYIDSVSVSDGGTAFSKITSVNAGNPLIGGDTGVSLNVLDFASDLTEVSLRNANNTKSILNFSGTNPNYLIDIPDVTTITVTNTEGALFTTTNNEIMLYASDGATNATLIVTYNPKAGYGVQELSNVVKTDGSLAKGIINPVTDYSQVLFRNNDGESVTSEGIVKTSHDVNENVWVADYETGLWKTMTWIYQSSSGNLIASDSTISGNGIKTIQSNGSLINNNSTLNAIAIREIVCTGDLTASNASTLGIAIKSLQGNGTLLSVLSDIDAIVFKTIIGSGAFISSDSTTYSINIRTLDAIGSLQSQPSIVSGEGIKTLVAVGNIFSLSNISGIANKFLNGGGNLIAQSAFLKGSEEFSGGGNLISRPSGFFGFTHADLVISDKRIAKPGRQWAYIMDPSDYVDFKISYIDLLNVQEQLESNITLTLDEKAIEYGVKFDSKYTPIVTTDREHILFWLYVDKENENNIIYKENALLVEIEATVYTNENRKYQRTNTLKIKQL